MGLVVGLKLCLVWGGKEMLMKIPFIMRRFLPPSLALCSLQNWFWRLRGVNNKRLRKGKKMLCISWMDGGGHGEVGEVLYSPLCSYPSIVLGNSGYLDWVLQCVKEIY